MISPPVALTLRVMSCVLVLLSLSCHIKDENAWKTKSEQMQKNFAAFKEDSIPVIALIENFKTNFNRLPDDREFQSMLIEESITTPSVGRKLWKYVYFENEYQIFVSDDPSDPDSDYPRYFYKSRFEAWGYDG